MNGTIVRVASVVLFFRRESSPWIFWQRQPLHETKNHANHRRSKWISKLITEKHPLPFSLTHTQERWTMRTTTKKKTASTGSILYEREPKKEPTNPPTAIFVNKSVKWIRALWSKKNTHTHTHTHTHEHSWRLHRGVGGDENKRAKDDQKF